MKIKFILALITALIIGSLLCFADFQEQANQVSRITGVAPNRVAKMAEAMDKIDTAIRYAHVKEFEKAIQLLDGIIVQNGFNYENERQARITKIETIVLSGDFKMAYRTAIELNKERALLDDYMNFIKAMADFSDNRDPKTLLDYVDLYNSRNKNIIPPKVYDSNYLSRMVRLYEMAGEIDLALDLVDEYHTYYFPKKGFKNEPSLIFKKRQDGLRLLKTALLRDKQESKNIYAQELINTTDYFGFV